MTIHDMATWGGGAFIRFLLVFARCISMLVVLPVFSGHQLPPQVRLGLSAFLAYFIASALPNLDPIVAVPLFVVAILAQIGVGLLLGFLGSLVFAGIQFTGEIIDTQVGFAITNVINPLNGTNVSILGQLQLMLASLLFLATDAHLLMLRGMADSFRVLPLPYAALNPALMHDVMLFFSTTLMLIFKIAAPIAVALLVTNVAMGFLARVAPQVNVFIVALPAQLGIGLVMFAFSLPIFGFVVPQLFRQLPVQFDAALRTMVVR